MKNKILGLFAGLLSLSFVAADAGDYLGMMGGSGNYGSGYGMMGGGIFGGLIYLLVIVNLVFLAIYLYKKIWGNK